MEHCAFPFTKIYNKSDCGIEWIVVKIFVPLWEFSLQTSQFQCRSISWRKRVDGWKGAGVVYLPSQHFVFWCLPAVNSISMHQGWFPMNWSSSFYNTVDAHSEQIALKVPWHGNPIFQFPQNWIILPQPLCFVRSRPSVMMLSVLVFHISIIITILSVLLETFGPFISARFISLSVYWSRGLRLISSFVQIITRSRLEIKQNTWEYKNVAVWLLEKVREKKNCRRVSSKKSLLLCKPLVPSASATFAPTASRSLCETLVNLGAFRFSTFALTAREPFVIHDSWFLPPQRGCFN